MQTLEHARRFKDPYLGRLEGPLSSGFSILANQPLAHDVSVHCFIVN
jgi:hypothetical protein